MDARATVTCTRSLKRRRREAEERADVLLATLRSCPLDIRSSQDVVLVVDGYDMPWIVDADRVALVLALLGIRSAVARRELLGADPPAGYVHAVVCVGAYRIPRWIKLRRMSAGGAA
jgi:hypothetical protein